MALLLLIGCPGEDRAKNSLFYLNFKTLAADPVNPYLEVVDFEGAETDPFAHVAIRTFRADENPNFQVETKNGVKEYFYNTRKLNIPSEALFHWQLDVFENKNEDVFFRLMKLHDGWEEWNKFEP